MVIEDLIKRQESGENVGLQITGRHFFFVKNENEEKGVGKEGEENSVSVVTMFWIDRHQWRVNKMPLNRPAGFDIGCRLFVRNFSGLL